jgi:acetyl-CoA C-acetyltransferase
VPKTVMLGAARTPFGRIGGGLSTEAFASVALNSMRMLCVDESKANVNGGAIALGHPIGASGARIPMTLALELRRRGGGLGCAAACSGGGQGDAMILEVDGG